jgi:hypothetical protein
MEAKHYSEALVAQQKLAGRNFIELVNDHIGSIFRRIEATGSPIPNVPLPRCS